MGNLVSHMFSALSPPLASCDGSDFSLQVVSEVFAGKVRFLNYPVHVSSDVFGRPPCSVTA
jgi:hypothetical protein